MMEWSEVMGRRDRLATLLRPHLGKAPARERANDIIQALLCADELPTDVALRMLARDMEPRAAEVVAYQIGRAWEAPAAAPALPAEPANENRGRKESMVAPISAATAAARRAASRYVRPRRETVILGLWN